MKRGSCDVYLSFVEATFLLAPIDLVDLLIMPESLRHGKRRAHSLPRSLALGRSARERGEVDIETDSYFCELCLAALDDRLPISGQSADRTSICLGYYHYQDIDSWRNAANDGCYSCVLLWRRFIPDSSDISWLFTDLGVFHGIRVSFCWRTLNLLNGKDGQKHRNISVIFRLGSFAARLFDIEFVLEVLQGHERAQINRAVGSAGTEKARLLLGGCQ